MTYFYALRDREDLDNPATLQPPTIGKYLIERFRTLNEIGPDEALVHHYQAVEGDYRFITEAPSGMQTRYSIYSKDGEWHAFKCDSSLPRR